jgi:uncharacterized protein
MGSFKEVVQNRRSFYALSDKSLLGDQHRRLWEITKETLKAIVPESAYPTTEGKIDKSFASGYGTVLFYEDKAGVRALQEKFPAYSDNFPVWSQQSSAMHQFTIWALLEEAGFGVSLQHYGNLIVEKVSKEWKISPDWELIAQMPFGLPLEQPAEKEFLPIEERVFVFK